jgi:hypothetical protein
MSWGCDSFENGGLPAVPCAGRIVHLFCAADTLSQDLDLQ